jgi:hypothetical protein
MPILGVNAYHGDSSAALFTGSVLQAAVKRNASIASSIGRVFRRWPFTNACAHRSQGSNTSLSHESDHLARKVARVEASRILGPGRGQARNILEFVTCAAISWRLG